MKYSFPIPWILLPNKIIFIILIIHLLCILTFGRGLTSALLIVFKITSKGQNKDLIYNYAIIDVAKTRPICCVIRPLKGDKRFS